ncbi:MAG: TRAP transporter substrate-binding protein [Geminicoccaceae bacterium]|nr:MAG: TRAP transporter substrate-binding protein [Geminicoccaceae bacterium]
MNEPIKPAASAAPATNNRRGFLKVGAAAAVGGAAVGFPNVVRAQTTRFTMQMGWPSGDMFAEFANDYVNMVNAMSGGRLQITMLPAGAVVGALELQDAIVGGALDGAHGVTAYWYGKDKAASLFGTPPAFGWNANQFLGWMKYGGGQELYDELVQDILGLDLVGFLTGPMPTQALGWFRQPISSAEDLRGLRYRTVGLAADVFQELGTAVTILGGPDIVPALDRGVIDAAEFNNPASDKHLGFQDVSKHWMLQSFHQDAEAFEISFNRTKFNALSDDLKAILLHAGEAASSDMSWKAMQRYPRAQRELVEDHGVNLYITPDEILEAQLRAWDVVIERNSAENPFFAKVIDSQKAWVRDVVGFDAINEAPKMKAYNHFFDGPPLSVTSL